MIKAVIQVEDITLINTYAPNIGAPKYMKQLLTEIKWDIDENTIIVGDFNTTLTSLHRSSRQKINKAKEKLNNTIEKLGLVYIFRALNHRQNRIHILSKCTWDTFQD